jgi:hypothetical protein
MNASGGPTPFLQIRKDQMELKGEGLQLSQGAHVGPDSADAACHADARQFAIMAADRDADAVKEPRLPSFVHDLLLVGFQFAGLFDRVPRERPQRFECLPGDGVLFFVAIGFIVGHPVFRIIFRDAVTCIQAKGRMTCYEAVTKSIISISFEGITE